MYCFNCGITVIDGASFCQSCGASVKTEAVPAPVIPEVQTDIPVINHDLDAQKAEEVRPREEFAQEYPSQVPEFTAIPEPATEFIPSDIPDIIPDITPDIIPEQAPNPIPEPFPETLPDSFPDPTKSAGVSVTGITKGEISGSYRQDPGENKNETERSFTFAEDTEKTDNFKFNNKTAFENKPKEKEKAYFGKPAFVFCLLIITVLSILCGVFAGLYLKSSDRKSLFNTVTNGITEIYEHCGNVANG